MRRWYIRKLAAVVLGVSLPAAVCAQSTLSNDETPLIVPPVTVMAPQAAPVEAPKAADAKPVDAPKAAVVAPAAPAPAPIAVPADPFRAASPYNPVRVGVATPNAEWNRPNFTLPCDLPLNLDTYVPRVCEWGKGNGGCGSFGQNCGYENGCCANRGCGFGNLGGSLFGGCGRCGGNTGCDSGCDNGCGRKFSFNIFNRGDNCGCDDGCGSKWSFGGLFNRDRGCGCDTGCQPANNCCTPVKQCGHKDQCDPCANSSKISKNWLCRAFSGPSADLGCFGCSNTCTEATFVFGSCRAFYGEKPCKPTTGCCGANGCGK